MTQIVDYTEQSLIFNQSPLIASINTFHKTKEKEDFSQNGYLYLKEFSDLNSVQEYLFDFVAGLNGQMGDKFSLFENRLQLAKTDRIPSPYCQDAVAISQVSFHFDMGLPVIATHDYENVYLLTCLYFPMNESPSATRTRLFDTKGLLKNFNLDLSEIEKNLVEYVMQYGDGDERFKSGRLASLGRVLEASLNCSPQLLHMRNHRIADWFNKNKFGKRQEGLEEEEKYFNLKGINLSDFEKNIHLSPGDLLVIDNTRMAHGRIGTRKAGEIYQLMYGVQGVNPSEIDQLRHCIIKDMNS